MPTRNFQELLDEMPAARRKKIAKGVQQALAAMPLEEVRRARQMTQVALAQILGVNQGEVSKIEHRTDVYLSTLAGYVEALGGRLEIRAVFPDREMRSSQFEGLAKQRFNRAAFPNVILYAKALRTILTDDEDGGPGKNSTY